MRHAFHFLAYLVLAAGCGVVPAPTPRATPSNPVLSLEQGAPEAIRQREAFRTIVSRARSAQASCAPRNYRVDKAEIRGKVILWDTATDDISEIQAYLPADTRASGPDGELAVLLVQKEEQTKEYTPIMIGAKQDSKPPPGKVTGIETSVKISVIQMPQQLPLGLFHINGESLPTATDWTPGETIRARWIPNVTKWIESNISAQQPPEPRGTRTEQVGEMEYHRDAVRSAKLLPNCVPPATPPTLPANARAVIWDNVLFQRSPAHRLLPDDLQAIPRKHFRETVYFFVLETKYAQRQVSEKGEGFFDRVDYQVAIVQLSEGKKATPKPLGLYSVEGEPWPSPWSPAKGNYPDNAQTLANWVAKFLKSPHAAAKDK